MKRASSLGLLALVASLLLGGEGHLQYVKAAPFTGKGLTISPPSRELTIKPGDSVTETVKITNPTPELLEVFPASMDFKAKDDSGEPAFYVPEKDTPAKYALSSWVSFPQGKIALAPQQVVNFTYTITVPADAEPGGHYGAVFFANEPPKTEATGASEVSITSMVGSLVLIRVPGNIKDGAQLLVFDSQKSLYMKSPIDFSFRIENEGNVHFRPRGEIIIKNWQGKYVESVPVNVQQGNVLPDSSRSFHEKWSPAKAPMGRFTANLAVIYGDSGNTEGAKTLSRTVTFWVLPLWIFLVIGVGILILITIFILVRIIIKQRK